MVAMSTEPRHVGDYAIDCPACPTVLNVPVFVELLPSDLPDRVELRTSANVDVIAEHVREHRRLSRPAAR